MRSKFEILPPHRSIINLLNKIEILTSEDPEGPGSSARSSTPTSSLIVGGFLRDTLLANSNTNDIDLVVKSKWMGAYLQNLSLFQKEEITASIDKTQINPKLESNRQIEANLKASSSEWNLKPSSPKQDSSENATLLDGFGRPIKKIKEALRIPDYTCKILDNHKLKNGSCRGLSLVKASIEIDSKIFYVDIRELKTSLKTDAQMRDYSCNSIFFDLKKNKLIDYCNGQQAILKRILEPVENLKSTFTQKVRIFRGIRQAAFYQMNLCPNFLQEASSIELSPSEWRQNFSQEMKKIINLPGDKWKIALKYLLHAQLLHKVFLPPEGGVNIGRFYNEVQKYLTSLDTKDYTWHISAQERKKLSIPAPALSKNQTPPEIPNSLFSTIALLFFFYSNAHIQSFQSVVEFFESLNPKLDSQKLKQNKAGFSCHDGYRLILADDTNFQFVTLFVSVLLRKGFRFASQRDKRKGEERGLLDSLDSLDSLIEEQFVSLPEQVFLLTSISHLFRD